MARKGGGSLRLSSVIATAFVIALVISWVKINDIRTAKDIHDYFYNYSEYIRVKCDAENLRWQCKDGGDSGRSTEANGGKTGKGTNPSATKALPADVKASVLQYTKDLNSLPVREPAAVTYSRREWKHWVGKPCNTREQVLIAAGKNVQVDDPKGACTVKSGTWTSVYDGQQPKVITTPKEMDIDHVVPLGWAAKQGGQSWSPATKQAFANDREQLLAVSFSENRGKGDSGPAEYMPPNKAFHCEYSKLWVRTLKKYNLTINAADKKALLSGIQTCEKV